LAGGGSRVMLSYSTDRRITVFAATPPSIKAAQLGAERPPDRACPSGFKLLSHSTDQAFPFAPFGSPTKCLTCRSDSRFPNHRNATLRLLSACRPTCVVPRGCRGLPRHGRGPMPSALGRTFRPAPRTVRCFDQTNPPSSVTPRAPGRRREGSHPETTS
jgi:hypothetical protein